MRRNARRHSLALVASLITAANAVNFRELSAHPGVHLDVADSPAADEADAASDGLDWRSIDGLAKPWPFRRDNGTDAWIFNMHYKLSKVKNMYDPAIYTIGEGLASTGASVAYTSDGAALLREVTEAVGAGRRPLVVAIGVWFASEATAGSLEGCAQAGARIVLYQTEPHTKQSNFTARLTAFVQKYNAEEVWDYSLCDLPKYGPEISRRRYVPPGYVASLEVGVDLDSPRRDESVIAFLGGLRYRSSRMKDRVNRTFGGRFYATNSVWTSSDLRRYLERYPLQVNIHKEDIDSMAPMEAFRMTLLLSNKACMLSAPAYPGDMPYWKDIVHYREMADFGTARKELQKDVRACQERTYAAYKEKFAPAKILQDSGFLATWSPASASASP